MFRRACIFAFIVAALAAACAGPRGAVPSVAPASSARSHAGTSTLTVTLSIVAPALGGKRLKIFAYPLTWQGPAATPPPASLVLDANVSSGSKRCASGSGAARTCTLSAQTPMGNDAIVAFLLAGNRVVARGFVQTAVTGPATLDLDAGNVAVSSLTISAPLALKKRVFSVGVTPLAADGASVMLGRGRSIAVSVYGPTRVVPSPQATVGAKAATATFAFRGRSFVNPITVAAVIGTMSNTARIFPNRKVPHACAPLSDTNVYEMAQPSIPSSFGMQAAVAGSDPVGVALDTGSTSFAIAQAKLTGAQTSQLVGPGQYAQQTYEPSGTTIKGNYYLAPVTVYEPSADGSEKIGTTVPMEVLVTTQACAKNQPCVTDTSTAYMGVGFGRPTPDPSTAPGLMNGPLENAFLQLRSIVQGKMHPGFELTANSLTIGVNSATMSGVPTVQLSPFPYRPGDWDGP
ncbi:MAG TPA: hypothetical protein VNG31_10275 [Candidatus Baltobacteraceae bacterium]|nr:hypothetical protein [Candidatus Baltobacteraceae bacterium]